VPAINQRRMKTANLIPIVGNRGVGGAIMMVWAVSKHVPDESRQVALFVGRTLGSVSVLRINRHPISRKTYDFVEFFDKPNSGRCCLEELIVERQR